MRSQPVHIPNCCSTHPCSGTLLVSLFVFSPDAFLEAQSTCLHTTLLQRSPLRGDHAQGVACQQIQHRKHLQRRAHQA